MAPPNPLVARITIHAKTTACSVCLIASSGSGSADPAASVVSRVDPAARMASSGHGPAEAGPHATVGPRLQPGQSSDRQQRPHPERIEASRRQQREHRFAISAGSQPPPECRRETDTRDDRRHEPAARDKNNQPRPDQIELFLDGERPEVTDRPRPRARHEDPHVRQVGQVPAKRLAQMRDVREPREREREVERRKDAQRTPHVERTQRGTPFADAGFAVAADVEQDVRDQESAEHEEQMHAGAEGNARTGSRAPSATRRQRRRRRRGGRRVEAGIAAVRSIPQLGQHAERHRLAALESPQVLGEEVDHLVPVSLPEAGRVRRQDDVRQRPQRVVRRQRLRDGRRRATRRRDGRSAARRPGPLRR